MIKEFFTAIQLLNETDYIQAYHDRSDGGLITTLVEMAFASRSGLDIRLPSSKNLIAAMFSEELGAVIQVEKAHLDAINTYIDQYPRLKACVSEIAQPNESGTIKMTAGESTLFEQDLFELLAHWSATTIQMQALRDNPVCAQQEQQTILDRNERNHYSNASATR